MKKHDNKTTNDDLRLRKEIEDEVLEVKKKEAERQKLITRNEQFQRWGDDQEILIGESFKKMLKMGIPRPTVEAKMVAEGWETFSILDGVEMDGQETALKSLTHRVTQITRDHIFVILKELETGFTDHQKKVTNLKPESCYNCIFLRAHT